MGYRVQERLKALRDWIYSYFYGVTVYDVADRFPDEYEVSSDSVNRKARRMYRDLRKLVKAGDIVAVGKRGGANLYNYIRKDKAHLAEQRTSPAYVWNDGDFRKRQRQAI